MKAQPNLVGEVETILSKYIPKVNKYTGDGYSLERMWPLLKAVGNPQEQLNAIHIAGTSGKTSTAYYISALLKSTGAKVGLTVSPHVDSIKERVQINNKFLSDEQFYNEFVVFMNLVKKAETTPSYFELLIVFIYWEFVRQKVDYAVIETGLGGLLDGTNVITKKNKVCVITDIGFDHIGVLGNTLKEIARQKAGVIQSENVVFIYNQSKQVMEQVNARVLQKNAILNSLNYDELLFNNSSKIETLPAFQKRNWLLSNSVFEYLLKRDNLGIASRMSPSEVVIPGRMEVVSLPDGSILIMDGAHNEQKMETFINSFKELYPNKKAFVMMALKRDKDYPKILKLVSQIADKFVFTTFNTYQDTPAISIAPKELSEELLRYNIKSTESVDNHKALNQLLGSSNDIKLVIGSFYLLGQVRPFIDKVQRSLAHGDY